MIEPARTPHRRRAGTLAVFTLAAAAATAAAADKDAKDVIADWPATPREVAQATIAKYADTAMAFMKGEKRPYTQKLQFDVARSNTGDPDQPAPMK